MVRQPARRRVPPDPDARWAPRIPATWSSTSTHRPARRSMWSSARRSWCARRWPTPACRRGQDQWREGPAHLSAARRSGAGRGRGRRDQGDRRPRGAARPDDRHHGLHRGRPGGQGLPRLHPGRRGDRGRRLQPAGPARARRCRSRSPGTSSTTSRRRISPIRTAAALLGDTDPWQELMPEPQTLPGRPDRGGPHHPGRPGAGDARGQAAGPRPEGIGGGIGRPAAAG